MPVRGGERIQIKIAGNSPTNKGLDFADKPSKYFYVSAIVNVMDDGERESLVLNLVSREAITNETVRVGKKFTTEEPISASVREILEDQKYLSTDKINIIEDTQNNYGFIGNMKKPFTVITWLASKSVSGGSENQPKDGTAGFLFYETKDGFNFRSIDSLIEQEPFEQTYRFAPNVVNSDDPLKDFKILNYNINKNQNLLNKLERGTYSSQRYYINPLTFETEITHFKSSDYTTNNLGSDEIGLPTLSEDSQVSLADAPTRIFTAMLDVGTLEKETSKKGGKERIKTNADPSKIDAQTMLRYNSLTTQVVEMTIPLNTELSAGSIIDCEFPTIDIATRHSPDQETSGHYIIKEMSHLFTNEGSHTKLKLKGDTHGKKKMIENNLLKTNFLGKDGFRCDFIGIVSEEVQGDQLNLIGNAWGCRLKVRIIGYHPADVQELADEDLPWAQVLLSPQGGSGKANRARSLRISPGDVVMGFFLDGDDAQLPVILGIFANTGYAYGGDKPYESPFKPFTGYTSKIKPNPDFIQKNEGGDSNNQVKNHLDFLLRK